MQYQFRSTLVAALVATFAAAPAFAGGYVAPTAPPPAATPDAPAHDWTGFYVGVGYSALNAESGNNTGFPTTPLIDQEAFMAFGGYRHQIGNYVLGGELVYLASESPLTSAPTLDHSDVREARLTAGVAFDRLLVSGIVGYGAVTHESPVAGNSADLDGFVYGVSIDYAVTDAIFAGLEYVTRDYSGLNDVGSSTIFHHDDAISLRVGFSF